MAVYKLTDFSDIISAVMEELKLQATDETSKTRIKRIANMVYLNEVVPISRWPWLNGYTTVTHAGYYSGGTVSVTPTSATATLSVAPASSNGDAGSFLGYKFSVDQTNEIYTITAHTALSQTITLDKPYNGTLNTAATFKIWKDEVDLPVDFRESVDVWHDHASTPLLARGLQEYRKLVSRAPKAEGRPEVYSTYDYKDPSVGTPEYELDRFRVMKVYPSLSQYTTILKVDYVIEPQALELDGDEPLIPINDRIVLFYGILSHAWGSIMRNTEEAMRHRQLFEAHLSRMMGKVQDTHDKPKVQPDSVWARQMRGNRIKGMVRKNLAGIGGGATHTAPTYLEDVTINGAQITGDVTVTPGVTIDGVDLSALATEVDDHVNNVANAHAASAITVTPTGTLVSSNVQDALVELQGELDVVNGLQNGYILVGDASDNASEVLMSGDVTIDNTGVTIISAGAITDTEIASGADIARSKIASGSANVVVVNDGTGALSESTVTSTELGYLDGVTSSVQDQLDDKASTELDNLGTTAINADLLPEANATKDLGSLTKRWAEGHFEDVTTTSVEVYSQDMADSLGSIAAGNDTGGGATDGDILIQATDTGTTHNTYGIKATAVKPIGITTVDNGSNTATVEVKTGDAAAGSSGDITIATGTATSDRGTIFLSAKVIHSIGALAVSSDGNSTSGSAATVSGLNSGLVLLTNSLLVSVTGLAAPALGSQVVLLSNVTGNSITILNESGGTAANRILTGTGASVVLANNASLLLVYDDSNSRWRVVGGSGGGSESVATVTGTATLDLTYNTVLADSTTSFTITLPAAASSANKIYKIKKTNTGDITIDGNSSETIDGALTKVLTVLNECVTIQCNGTAWYII